MKEYLTLGIYTPFCWLEIIYAFIDIDINTWFVIDCDEKMWLSSALKYTCLHCIQSNFLASHQVFVQFNQDYVINRLSFDGIQIKDKKNNKNN